jgi:hypothetical protein
LRPQGNPLVGENPPDFIRRVGVLSPHQLSPGFHNGHFAAESTIGLRQFETGLATADHDQMRHSGDILVTPEISEQMARPAQAPKVSVTPAHATDADALALAEARAAAAGARRQWR